jgi:single-stranded DNA-binding protein
VNLAESAQKGTRIEVSGRVVENTFTATRGERMGQEVRRWEVVADHVSISLANQR